MSAQHLTDLNWLSVGEDWPPKSQNERLQKYITNTHLFEGYHDKVYDSWPRVLREDLEATLEMVLNWPKRLTTLWGDLVAGDPPTCAVGSSDSEGAYPAGGDPLAESPEQQQLDEIIERNQYYNLLYEIVVDMSRYGDAVFRISLRNGKAKIGGQSPKFWFPVVSIADVREVQYHVLAWPFKAIAKQGSPRFYGTEMDMVKVEIHSRGQIEHRVLAVGPNKKIEHLETVRDHFAKEFMNREVLEIIGTNNLVEETGIDDFLVQHSPGLRGIDRLYGLDDYTDLESIVQEMEVRLAQIARILDKHADPTMFGPESLIVHDRITGETEFAGTGKYLPVPEGETPPAYLTWDGLLQAAYSELEELKLQFYLITETSPAAFGQADAGLATSGTALRRLMQAPLAKARRMRRSLDPVAKQVLRIAGELENRSQGSIGLRNKQDAAA